MQTLTRWIALPENRSARAGVERVAESVCGADGRNPFNPLFLHGPSGTGKTHLVTSLLAGVAERAPGTSAVQLTAREIGPALPPGTADDEGEADLAAARQADLVVLEDLQHLTARAAERLAPLVDRCLARGQQLVCTARAGPAQLHHLPARLTSRLAGGLVVGLLPLGPASRLAVLEEGARRRQLHAEPAALRWLADHLGGSFRQLEGALARLETLARLDPGPLTLAAATAAFQTDADVRRPTVERIADQVGSYFRVEPRALVSRRRGRDVLLPRQVGMYLARQLTGLSLEQIGAFFGGRDHSTVLHACRKVEQALDRDVALSGAVRQLRADLA